MTKTPGGNMKRILFSVFALAFVLCLFFAWGCKATPSTPGVVNTSTVTRTSTPQSTGTATQTITPTYTVTETATEQGTYTATPTITATVLGRWYFDGSLEGWQRTTSVYTAFSDIYYTTANYSSAPGAAGIDCNFTGTGGAASQIGRVFIDFTSQPADLTGKFGISTMIYIPPGMTDKTPPYNLNTYIKTDGGAYAYGAGAALTTADGWSGWCNVAISKPGGAVMLEGIIIEITKPDGSGDFSGTMYIDSITLY